MDPSKFHYGFVRLRYDLEMSIFAKLFINFFSEAIKFEMYVFRKWQWIMASGNGDFGVHL
jgi:hypothetical protein